MNRNNTERVMTLMKRSEVELVYPHGSMRYTTTGKGDTWREVLVVCYENQEGSVWLVWNKQNVADALKRLKDYSKAFDKAYNSF
jgi:hypothetical protein